MCSPSGRVVGEFLYRRSQEAVDDLRELDEKFITERAPWHLSAGIFWHEAETNPKGLRIQCVHGKVLSVRCTRATTLS